MLHVELENILPEEEAVTKIRELLELVDTQKQIVVVNRAGRAAVALIDIKQLEDLTGHSVGTPSSQPSMSVAPGAEAVQPDLSFPAMSMPPMPAPEPMTPPAPAPIPMPGTPVPPITPPEIMDMPDIAAPSTMSVTDAPMPSAPAPAPAPATPPPDLSAPVSPAAPVTPAPIAPPRIAEDLPEMPEDPTNSSPLS